MKNTDTNNILLAGSTRVVKPIYSTKDKIKSPSIHVAPMQLINPFKNEKKHNLETTIHKCNNTSVINKLEKQNNQVTKKKNL